MKTEATMERASHEVPCPLCESTNYRLYALAPSHYGPERHNVTQCNDCGMVFTNPQFDNYEEEVENLGMLPRHLRPEKLRIGGNQARLQLKLISQYLRRGSLFDFGSGAGCLVKAAIDQGWSATGFDLNRGLVEAANAHWGFDNLKTGRFEEFLEYNSEMYDVVVSNQVFEHLQKPVALGRTLVERLLKPSGVILIDVPNVQQPKELLNRGKTLDPTAHWCHFSKRTLARLMQQIGCEPLYVNASPSLVQPLHRFGLRDFSYSIGTTLKKILPPVGTGVCVIGRKITR